MEVERTYTNQTNPEVHFTEKGDVTYEGCTFTENVNINGTEIWYEFIDCVFEKDFTITSEDAIFKDCKFKGKSKYVISSHNVFDVSDFKEFDEIEFQESFLDHLNSYSVQRLIEEYGTKVKFMKDMGTEETETHVLSHFLVADHLIETLLIDALPAYIRKYGPTTITIVERVFVSPFWHLRGYVKWDKK